ncbi:MAG TPA: hypothetical protein DCP69_01380 [Candidatus Omnitrophica bacterium]|nr:hypothetical protein [Candidatus Omnitrophota bacterium]
MKQRQWFPEGVNELARSRSRCGYGQRRLLHLGVEEEDISRSLDDRSQSPDSGNDADESQCGVTSRAECTS